MGRVGGLRLPTKKESLSPYEPERTVGSETDAGTGGVGSGGTGGEAWKEEGCEAQTRWLVRSW